jgi:hypothetical protein
MRELGWPGMFKLTETNGEYEVVCLNPNDIPPDDLDDVILGRMIKEAGMFYKMELERDARVIVKCGVWSHDQAAFL